MKTFEPSGKQKPDWSIPAIGLALAFLAACVNNPGNNPDNNPNHPDRPGIMKVSAYDNCVMK